MKQSIFARLALCLPVLSLLALVGCGGTSPIATDAVEGIVTYKNEPVEGARVMFSPVNAGGTAGGSPAYGVTDATGKYLIQTQDGAVGKGTTPGTYKVTVSKSRDVGTGKFEMSPEGEKVELVKGEDLLPLKYKMTSSSPLTVTVEAGKQNKFDFDLGK